MVRTRIEVQEQTQVGDALVRGLMRAQLGLALRLAAVVVSIVAPWCCSPRPHRNWRRSPCSGSG